MAGTILSLLCSGACGRQREREREMTLSHLDTVCGDYDRLSSGFVDAV